MQPDTPTAAPAPAPAIPEPTAEDEYLDPCAWYEDLARPGVRRGGTGRRGIVSVDKTTVAIHGNNHFLSYRLNDLRSTPLWKAYMEYARRGTDDPDKHAHYRQCIDCFLCWLCTTPSIAVCDLGSKLNCFKE